MSTDIGVRIARYVLARRPQDARREAADQLLTEHTNGDRTLTEDEQTALIAYRNTLRGTS